MTPTPDEIAEPGHDLSYHTEACFQRSRVIKCDGDLDTRRCSVCGKEWTERCNFDEDYA